MTERSSANGERNRGLYVLKSRGMAHSNQIREFLLTNRGVELNDVYVGPAGLLTGSARLAQEARETAEQLVAAQDVQQQQTALERKRHALESQIAALCAEFAANEMEAQRLIRQGELRKERLTQDRTAMGLSRLEDEATTGTPNTQQTNATNQSSGEQNEP